MEYIEEGACRWTLLEFLQGAAPKQDGRRVERRVVSWRAATWCIGIHAVFARESDETDAYLERGRRVVAQKG